MEILEDKIEHVTDSCVKSVLELFKSNIDPTRIPTMVNLPSATVKTIKWVNESSYTEETKKLILSHIYYMEGKVICNFKTYRHIYAIHDAVDNYDVTKQLLNEVLCDIPCATLSMLQSIVAANMRTSLSGRSIVQLTLDFNYKLTYNLKCSKNSKSIDSVYENVQINLMRKLGNQCIHLDHTVLINIIKMKVVSRFYDRIGNEQYDDSCEENTRNFTYCTHKFYILISLTRRRIESLQIREGGGYNSDDVVEVLNSLFKKYEQMNQRKMLFVLGPGIPREKEHIAGMTKICADGEESTGFYSQAGSFIGTFHELIKEHNFEEVSGESATAYYMFPFRRLMEDFGIFFHDYSVNSPQDINDRVIDSWNVYANCLSTENLFTYN